MPVTISGLASDVDTEGIIKKLVEVERRPIKRLEREKLYLEYEKETWKELKKELNKLNSILKELYGFRRVFRKKTVNSDIKDYISATVLPSAKKGKHKINVKQLAKAHKILSDKTPIKKQLPGSIFEIKIGDKKVKVKGFKDGGTLKKLKKVLYKEAKKLINVELIKMDENNYVLSIESKKTGSKNRIIIQPEGEKDKKLLKEIGLIPSQQKQESFYNNFDSQTPTNLNFTPNGYNNTPSLLIKSKDSINYKLPVETLCDKISFYYKMNKLQINTGNIGSVIAKRVGAVKIKDIKILGAEIFLNKPTIPSDTTITNNPAILKIKYSGGQVKTLEIKPQENWSKFTYNFSESVKIISLGFICKGEYNLLIDELKLEKKDKKFEYKNVVQKPQDAIIEVDGVKIKRDRNNNLNDVIEGLTLNLLKPTKEPVDMEIVVNKKIIRDKLNEFIEQYNKIIDFILEAGKNSSAKKPGENKKRDRGIISNDISLMNLHSKLRSTVIDRYKTSLGDELSILAQIGISTGSVGSSWQNIRKGYLQLDDTKLETALDKYGETVGEIFGYDTNDDKIIDTGVAYTLEKILKPFTQIRGILDGKIRLADTLIKSKEKLITRKEDDLKKYENSLKLKFGKMEEALQELKGTSTALENQINNLNNLKPGNGNKEK